MPKSGSAKCKSRPAKRSRCRTLQYPIYLHAHQGTCRIGACVLSHDASQLNWAHGGEAARHQVRSKRMWGKNKGSYDRGSNKHPNQLLNFFSWTYPDSARPLRHSALHRRAPTSRANSFSRTQDTTETLWTLFELIECLDISPLLFLSLSWSLAISLSLSLSNMR